MVLPDNFPVNLNPSDSPLNVSIQFTPQGYGSKSAVFNIKSNAPEGNTEIRVNGTGLVEQPVGEARS